MGIYSKTKEKIQQRALDVLLTDLKSSSMRKDLLWGKRIHAKATEGHNYLNMFFVTALVKMYAKCGSMVDAHRVFDSMQKPDVVSWTILLMGYAENGEGLATLGLFSRMKVRGCVPDPVSYVAVLKACTSLAVNGDVNACLKQGREVHLEIGCHLDHYVQNSLIDMYAKCGCMVEARAIFDNMAKPDVVSWNALLMGYAEYGEGHVALDLFSKMKARRCIPDSISYVVVLKACTSLAMNGDDSGKKYCLERGREIHSQIGCHVDHYVQSTLIDMYGKCGSMVDARRVFDSMKNPSQVTWNALLLGYAASGEGHIALDLFSRMRSCGCFPNSVTYMAALRACAVTGALALGRKVHSQIHEFTTHLVTCLVDCYAKCGSMVEARDVFDSHPIERDVTTWTALLAGYGSLGDSGSVFNLFELMQDKGLRPDAVTFVCLLLCCSHAGFIDKAREYLEAMPVYYQVTPDVTHYTCMVDVLGRSNQLNEALAVIQKMPCNPDLVTWMTLLGACRKWKNVEIGRGAFQALVDSDKKNSSAYILMAHLYGSKGMREEQERVLETRIKFGACKLGQAYVTDDMGRMVKFVVGERDPPEMEDKLQQLCENMRKQGYVSESYSMSNIVVDANEEECGHCERRAVVYGLVNTPPWEAVRVFKNTRMCEDCHCTAKIISKVSARAVMIKDTTKFHVMVNGNCSCGDYW